MKLRGYQTNIIDEVRAQMVAGQKRILICAPTGSGKTALTANMLGTAAGKGHHSWFIVHRRELVKQSIQAFDKAGVNHGVIANGFIDDPKPHVQVCSIGTLKNRHVNYKTPRLIIWDECHHLGAKSWEKIFDEYPNSFHVGLTATPQRSDGRGLDKYFSCMVSGPPVEQLTDMGFLSRYKLFAPGGPNLSGVHSRMGDYIKSEILEMMDKPTITGSAIKEYTKRAKGKRAVAFAISIKHSQHIVEEFRSQGIAAEHVDGETDQAERDAAIERFRKGETLVLSNVDLFGEGFDLPSIECAILLRPTQSLGLYLQQVGRALRPYPGKAEAIILDHANNAAMHGLPCQDREWALAGRAARSKKSDTESSIKICTSCFAAQLPGSTICKFCGYCFPLKPRTVDEVDGDLVEVDPEKLKAERKASQKGAKTLVELTELGKERGYQRPHLWAKHIFNSRQRKKLGG